MSAPVGPVNGSTLGIKRGDTYGCLRTGVVPHLQPANEFEDFAGFDGHASRRFEASVLVSPVRDACGVIAGMCGSIQRHLASAGLTCPEAAPSLQTGLETGILN